jgi:hypothetical protein
MSSIRILLLISIIYSGINAVQEVTSGVDAGFLSVPLNLLGLIILTLAEILIGGIAFSNSKKIIHLFPSFIGCIFLVITVVQKNKFSDVENGKTLLSVRTKPGEEALYLLFKENGNFVIEEYNPPFGIKRFYGKYSLKNDTITIISHNYKGYAGDLPKVGFILKDTVYWNGFDKMILVD